VGSCECYKESSGYIKWNVLWTSWGPVRFSAKTVLQGVSYLGEKDVSVDTPVSLSETMCDLQVEQVYFKKNLLEYLSNYCRIYLGRKISCCSKSKLSNSSRKVGNRNRGLLTGSKCGGDSPQNRYGSRESFRENPEKG